MYLFNITNIDYAVMIIMFGCFALIAYYFRRKNSTSQKFLLGSSYSGSSLSILISQLGIGLPEFILFSSIGAIFGLSAFFIMLGSYFIIHILINQFMQKDFWQTIASPAKSNFHQRILSIYYIVFLLLISATAIVTIVIIFKGLIAWNFGNSTLSLMVLVGVCMIIGGFAGVFYGQIIASILTTVILFVLVMLAINHVGLSNVLPNLQSIATTQKHPINYFTSLTFNLNNITYILLALFSAVVVILANPWTMQTQTIKNCKPTIAKQMIKLLIKLFVIALSIAIGVIALATPMQKIVTIDGSIITTPTRLEDGTLGYVVKLVKDDGITHKADEAISSIIPINTTLATNDGLHYTMDEEHNADYDYASSAVTLIKNLVTYAFIPLVLLINLFYRSISETISFAVVISINNIYSPYYNKSKEDLENLWAARVFMFMYFFIIIAIGLVLFKFFNYDYILGLLVIFAIPLVTNLLFKPNAIGLLLSLIIGILALLTLNIESVPSLVEMVNYSSWWNFVVIIASGLLIFSMCINLILNKVCKNK